MLVQAGQLSSIGRILAQDHQDFLEGMIQDKYNQLPTSDTVKGVQQATEYSHPEPHLITNPYSALKSLTQDLLS